MCLLEFRIKRDPKWGGEKIYTVFEEVEKEFAEEVNHSLTGSLKNTGKSFVNDNSAKALHFLVMV